MRDAVHAPRTRRSGLLLHPTSLPGPFGIGELGAAAHSWLEFLAESRQSLWQVMPLGPTGYGDSPYQSFSSFAGNHLLIDLGLLAEAGYLEAGELEPLRRLPAERVEFGALIPQKTALLTLAAERFLRGASDSERATLESFVLGRADWLEEYALFMALKEANGGKAWNEWEVGLRGREPAALAAAREQLTGEISRHKVWQYWFFEQWGALRDKAKGLGIEIIGDLPIFVALDSADTWANPKLFHLGAQGAPTVVAGVPPDYFSATGQRWGNPLYDWKALEQEDYGWWVRRVRATLELVDHMRLDHFRGFAAYWEIPAEAPTAATGKWVTGPGQAFFDSLREQLGELPFIAEDLGVITPDVEALRGANSLPGMKVLQFAFAGGANDPYLPHNYPRACVVYTGTHDNDTTVGWYEALPAKERDHVRRYLGRGDENITWELCRLALASVADTAILPLQDVLNLSSAARMNTPGVAGGNWEWRFRWEDVPYWVAPNLAELTVLYGRAGEERVEETPYRQTVLP